MPFPQFPDLSKIDTSNSKQIADAVAKMKKELEWVLEHLDGTNIVANSITAEHIQAGTIKTSHIATEGLDASVIKTGYLSANFIRGGTLLVGGSGVDYAILTVLAGGGELMAMIDSRGMLVFDVGDGSTVMQLTGNPPSLRTRVGIEGWNFTTNSTGSLPLQGLTIDLYAGQPYPGYVGQVTASAFDFDGDIYGFRGIFSNGVSAAWGSFSSYVTADAVYARRVDASTLVLSGGSQVSVPGSIWYGDGYAGKGWYFRHSSGWVLEIPD